MKYDESKDHTFDMNEEEIALYINDMKAQYESAASYYATDIETYLSMTTGMTYEEFEALCEETALYRIQSPLIETAIAEAEGLEVTDEFYLEKVTEYVEYYGFESVEDLEATYTKEVVMKQITADLAAKFLLDNAVAE